jgi:multiple sugar transport system permease protein
MSRPTSSVPNMQQTPNEAAQLRRRSQNFKGLSVFLNYLLLVALAAFFLFPLVFMFVSSIKNDELQIMKDMTSANAFIPSGDIGFQNYQDVFARIPFFRAFLNSLIVVIITVVLGLGVNSLFAYALARFRFVGRDFLLTLVVSLVIIPFQAIAVPLLLLVNQFGWLNSYHVQIIPLVANAFSIYLFYQFFIGLPKELEEAATVDGASKFRTYWSIMMPLSGPVFATVAILQFLARWGDLLWPVMTVQGDEFSPLPLSMQTFFGQAPFNWGDRLAFAAMATLPTLLVFLIFQRWFVKSAVSSGVKG